MIVMTAVGEDGEDGSVADRSGNLPVMTMPSSGRLVALRQVIKQQAVKLPAYLGSSNK